jgi:hypothetical protein
MDEKHKKNLNLLYTLDQHDMYQSFEEKQGDPLLAQCLHQNLSSMEETELHQIISKCMTSSELKHFLLKYEMKYWIPEKKEMTLKQFIKEAQKLLYRYQSRAGGFLLEDRKWTLHTKTSLKYHLKSNMILFENTISEDFIYDLETREYTQDLIDILNRLSSNVTVSMHSYHSPRDELYWIILKCKYQSSNLLNS